MSFRKPLTSGDPRHGTFKGFKAHYTQKVPLCDPCRTAANAYAATRRATERAASPRTCGFDGCDDLITGWRKRACGKCHHPDRCSNPAPKGVHCALHARRLWHTGQLGPIGTAYPATRRKPLTDNDQRHGTTRGYHAHLAENSQACGPCLAAQREAARRSREAALERDPTGVLERRFRSYLKTKYDITVEQFDQMWALAKGRCDICSRPLQRGKNGFAIDHNHETGEVRGLLCNHCNLGLGKFDDDPDTVQRAADYLKKHEPPKRIIQLPPLRRDPAA